MGLFKSASSAGRNRPSPPPPSNIRGKISGPIPIPEEEFSDAGLPGSNPAQESRPKQLEPATQRDSGAASTNTALNHTREDDKASSPAQSGPSQSSTPSTPDRRRTNRSSTLRYSTMSEATDVASPARKKSSLRAAFGRLFKKRNKKRASRSVSDSEAQVGPSNEHHRSDPVVGERERMNSVSEPKRSASLPVTEFNKALRSHSIGPDDYMAIHSARNSLQSDSVFLRRRAATASDGPIISKLRDQSLDISGLSPRPASAQGQDMPDEYDPDSIGRAVSVDYLTSRRRSRSLSQLHDVSEGQAPVRKRSEEIRYWRASQTPGLLSSNQSVSNREEPELTETTEPTEPTVETRETHETHEEILPAITPEPFNFGSISNMRITEAASLEERVAALEVKNQKLEKLVSQLFQVVPGIDKYSDALRHAASPAVYAATGSAVVETTIPHGSRANNDPLSPSFSVSEQSNVSFEDEKTFIGSIHPPTREAPRPISNVTIRGATSLPSLPRDVSGGFTTDHYDTLKALLDAERAMRHALEIRVTKLAHMVDMMSRTKQNLDRGTFLGGYTNVSTFDHDDDDDYDGTEPPSASVDGTSDAFETRQEERQMHSYDASDDSVQDGVDDDARKRAARTLSLGQLTLGKPKHTQQPGGGVDL
ncbi:hypothetical protein ONZ43_g6589 [Nemania bipapillata]|uniref:Uncharacterized protein n=1 Tax=Nemania bipapillata TaxID=110536 RepID=A0ACC2HZF7_9PEZI|nr:hypothetical protein ONZ43_g6589 [Nemania bipapillata]